ARTQPSQFPLTYLPLTAKTEVHVGQEGMWVLVIKGEGLDSELKDGKTIVERVWQLQAANKNEMLDWLDSLRGYVNEIKKKEEMGIAEFDLGGYLPMETSEERKRRVAEIRKVEGERKAEELKKLKEVEEAKRLGAGKKSNKMYFEGLDVDFI
ncbi:hypothetical protein HDU76_011121, partial [Blyttiomyces sp. JEL0837]